MAKIPLPERGQPIDVGYIGQIANAVNQISDSITPTGYNFSTISGKNVKTGDLRIIATSVDVPGTSQTADKVATFDFSYNLNFQSTPIVTATIYNTGRTDAGDAATVVLTDVNANSLSGLVRFQKTGDVTAKVNLIIIGIPGAATGAAN
jgi:hypothetical protein